MTSPSRAQQLRIIADNIEGFWLGGAEWGINKSGAVSAGVKSLKQLAFEDATTLRDIAEDIEMDAPLK